MLIMRCMIADGSMRSAIEVLRKLLDKEFVARLKSSGFVERIYTEFRKAEAGAGDRVSRLSSPPEPY